MEGKRNGILVSRASRKPLNGNHINVLISTNEDAIAVQDATACRGREKVRIFQAI